MKPHKRTALLACAGLLLGTATTAARPLPPAPGLGASCRDAIAVAEQAHSIPRGLLRAIGLQESGRRDPGTGTVDPWPWTVDVDGRGALFDTLEEAVAFVADAQRRGAASIDVGCMQINLQSHPAAFRSLEEAFDPVANTEYGARFLSTLFAETRNWELSTGYYHSRTPALAVPYRTAVAARLPSGPLLAGRLAAFEPVPPRPPSPLATLASAWGATLGTPPAADSGPAFPSWSPLPHPGTRRPDTGRLVVMRTGTPPTGALRVQASLQPTGFLTSAR